MAEDNFDAALSESAETATKPEVLVSTVLHLMSHYTAAVNEAGACTKLASVIERHLKALAGLPDLAPVLRATCEQLADQWSDIVERNMQPPARNGFFTRLMKN